MKIEALQTLHHEELAPLISASLAEGFQFIARLKKDWMTGMNQFKGPNERLYQISIDDKIIGIGGINNNPYQEKGSVGRLRHLYVHPDYRGKGLASQLIATIIQDFKGQYERFTLRTDNEKAAKFYESLGFQSLTNSKTSTHQRWSSSSSTEKIFETQRLLIREFLIEDFAMVHEYVSQKEVVQYQAWGPNEEADTLKFLRESIMERKDLPRLSYELAITLKAEQKLIGGCGLFLKKDNLSQAQIGYIINPRYWNQGYATEVCQAFVQYGLQTVGLKTIKATTDKRNLASQRVLMKSGFELEKLIEGDFLQKGVLRDTYLFAWKP